MTDRWASHLDRSSLEHSFHHISVASQHTSVMNSEARIEQLLHLFIP